MTVAWWCKDKCRDLDAGSGVEAWWQRYDGSDAACGHHPLTNLSFGATAKQRAQRRHDHGLSARLESADGMLEPSEVGPALWRCTEW
jgi:hypothetical protein